MDWENVAAVYLSAGGIVNGILGYGLHGVRPFPVNPEHEEAILGMASPSHHPHIRVPGTGTGLTC